MLMLKLIFIALKYFITLIIYAVAPIIIFYLFSAHYLESRMY